MHTIMGEGERVMSGGIAFVYATYPDSETAKEAAVAVVQAELAACANIIPAMMSVYRWEGTTETANETVAIFKTHKPLVPELMQFLRDMHPYDVPALLELPSERVDAPYRAWLLAGTKSSQGTD